MGDLSPSNSLIDSAKPKKVLHREEQYQLAVLNQMVFRYRLLMKHHNLIQFPLT